VVGLVNDSSFAPVYVKVGAFPVYMVSASLSMLFECVTGGRTERITPQSMLKHIKPECEDYPEILELFPVLSETPMLEVFVDEAIEDDTVPVDLNDDTPSTSAGGYKSPMSHRLDKVKLLMNPKRIRDDFMQNVERLKGLKDPVALFEKQVSQMTVVSEHQRDEYLDSLAELHNAKPITTNAMWHDLLAFGDDSKRITDVEKPHLLNREFYVDRQAMQSDFRSGHSVFEEYQNMTPRRRRRGADNDASTSRSTID